MTHEEEQKTLKSFVKSAFSKIEPSDFLAYISNEELRKNLENKIYETPYYVPLEEYKKTTNYTGRGLSGFNTDFSFCLVIKSKYYLSNPKFLIRFSFKTKTVSIDLIKLLFSPEWIKHEIIENLIFNRNTLCKNLSEFFKEFENVLEKTIE